MNEINQQLREVRKREGVTPRTMAKRLGITIPEYLFLESDEHELTVNELLRCQQALGVPLTELFDLEEPFPYRATILRAYKSARSLKEMVKERDEQVMVDRLLEDLLTVMPEMDGSSANSLGDVKAWPVVGQRRDPNEPSMRENNVVSSLYFGEVGSTFANVI